VLADDGLTQVGLLAAAFAISQTLTMLLTPAIALFLTPALNRDDSPRVKLQRTLQFRRSMLFAAAAVMLPLMLFPQTAIEVLFASEFTPVATYVYAFVLGEALGLLSGVNQALLVGLNDFAINVVYIVVGQVLLVGLVLVLVPALGIAGVAVALIANHALVLGLTTRRLSRRHGMAMLDGLRPFVPAAIGLAAIGAAVPSLPGGELALLAPKVAVLAVFLALGLYLYRTTSGTAHGS
jgi:O-antigen/teichoic acid export membrane protein